MLRDHRASLALLLGFLLLEGCAIGVSGPDTAFPCGADSDCAVDLGFRCDLQSATCARGAAVGPGLDGGAGLADAGLADAGRVDAGLADAGHADAGHADGGALDAGLPDGGAGIDDAGELPPPSDGGELDDEDLEGGVDVGDLDAGGEEGGPLDGGDDDGDDDDDDGALDAGPAGDLLLFAPVADAFIREQYQTSNYGSSGELRAGTGANYTNRAFVRFNVSSLPSCDIESAELVLHYFADGDAGWSGYSPSLGVHRVTSRWSEDYVTWRRRRFSYNWAFRGGDFASLAVDTVQVQGGQYGEVRWDVTWLVRGWCLGDFNNRGMAIVQPNDHLGTRGRKRFYSREHSQAALRPRLEVRLNP